MRKIVSSLRMFLKEDFHWGTYVLTFLMLAICLTLNYTLHLTNRWIYSQPDGWVKLVRWTAFMAFPYLIVIGLQAIFQKPVPGLKKPGFWAMLLLALLMVSTTAWFPWHKDLARQLFPRELFRWGLLVLWNLKRFAFMLAPLLLFWFLVDRKPKVVPALYANDENRYNQFYGLFTKPKGLGPYFLMLLIMVPLITIASFQPDFLKVYPQYFAGPAEAKVGVSPWLTGGVFEFVYLSDFALVELVFRGFLVIGFVRWLGPKVVLPMAAMYCFLHFGKPAGEAVASVFGGYILGVVAYYSRSIWGGIVVHMGVAAMMETAAYIQRTL
jgi:hypothetical protein